MFAGRVEPNEHTCYTLYLKRMSARAFLNIKSRCRLDERVWFSVKQSM